MKYAVLLMSLLLLAASSAPVLAGQPRSRAPKAKPAVQRPAAPAPARVATRPQPGNAGTRAQKPTTAKAPKTTKPAGGRNATAGTGRNTEPNARPTAATPAASNVPRNSQLADRLRTRLNLPSGADLTPYATGFRNQGQFIAAVNVSNNLGIPFGELKAVMVPDGITQTTSLGRAIQQLRPSADADAEVRRATAQNPR